jgi:cytidyltransferase-like protein
MPEKKYDIIILSGGFDPPHIGHVRMIQDARSRAKRVFVGINSDDWLNRKKGYVFMSWLERAEMVEAIKGVDEVRRFNDKDNTANALLKKIRKENPYSRIAFGNGGDRTNINTPEKETCEKQIIDMVWAVGGGYKAQSSSVLVDKIKETEKK